MELPNRTTRRATDHLPQHVEVRHEGAWRTGVLVGCRLHTDGEAQAHIRCTINGERVSLWSSFSYLRVPRTDSSPPAAPPAAAPAETAGRHRAGSSVVSVTPSRLGPADQLTTRLPLARISVPPPGGRPSGYGRPKR